MLRWQVLKQYDCKPPLLQLTRKPEIQTAYLRHKQNLQLKGLSHDEHIRRNILGDQEYVLTLNGFPYDLESGIEHYVFWMLPEKKISIECAKVYVEIVLGSEVIIFDNIEANRSVKTVPHYHVFIRSDHTKCLT